jgi:hypothetical protein
MKGYADGAFFTAFTDVFQLCELSVSFFTENRGGKLKNQRKAFS